MKGSCTVWGEMRGEVKAKVAMMSSGEAWEAEVTGPGGAPGIKATSGFGLTQMNTWQCHLLTGSLEEGGKGSMSLGGLT